jgi:hypothetical protein
MEGDVERTIWMPTPHHLRNLRPLKPNLRNSLVKEVILRPTPGPLATTQADLSPPLAAVFVAAAG